jgi:hypothetical protein
MAPEKEEVTPILSWSVDMPVGVGLAVSLPLMPWRPASLAM